MSKINTNYSKKFKLSVVKRYLDGVGGYGTVAKEMGVKNDSQVHSWVKKYQEEGKTAFDNDMRGKAKGGRKGRPKTKFNSLEEELKYLKMEVEYLKKLRALQKESKKINNYEIIYDMKDKYAIIHLCKIAGLQRSGYYSWLEKKDNVNPNNKINQEVAELMLVAHKESKGTYGIERLCLYVNKNMNIPINHKRIYRLQKVLGLKSVIRKKVYYKHYTPAKVCDNVLSRDFKATEPLQKLCMDVTYIAVNSSSSRFVYMNAVKDLFNGEIVAYDLSLRNDAALISSTLEKLSALPTSNDCILHTDQGSVYTRTPYFEKLKEEKFIASMSRRGNCWDNAPIESFFSHFKTESIYLTKTRDYEALIKEIHEYINYYNNTRIQKKLNGLSPVEFRIKTA